MNSDIDVNYEPLPGYRLTERIGAGGYGEVWRAVAPGGLTKAIKFVFGKQHERRASHELRALERVREVRHPFLLSLERIEVVDGRLMVITELASGSVKDRFEACRQRGLPGIPRDELLRYMRDAADALDYMSEQHSLQHLDIKPENLLLLAGHVKVGDFGLVKDVQQLEVSLVGGMTPLYAAPELFRGTPTRYSDQYSLAIVYQDMLTGTLPFAGRNAAELTLQHLNDEPDLATLSAADRYVVSRALAKNPRHRYGTCREFVEALATDLSNGPQPWAEVTGASGTASAAKDRPSSQTELFEEQCVAGRESLQPRRLALPPTGRDVTDLAPVNVDERQFRPMPTLLLGVGGIAGRVLAHLRRKMLDRYGAAIVPAMPLLWIDTDPTELAKANERAAGRLLAEETFALPLRRPAHYRDHSPQLLRWLSRRWLYNIPRSLHTEGLRPLGRLALVDHARQTGQRIRRAIIDAIDPDAIRASGQTLGRAFRRGDLRVYVLASISGGTGSGTSLDLGYLTRAVLNTLELPQAQVVGLMMHATGRDTNHSELARVNAYSWLSEFQYFQRPSNAYRNDGSCCMPAHAPQVPPFDTTYLVHLGDSLDLHELDSAAESVADYLQCDTQTPARAFFDACRQSADDVAPAGGRAETGTQLRSFGMFAKPAVAAEFCDELAAAVGRRVVLGWLRPSATDADRETVGDTATDHQQPSTPPPSDTTTLDGTRLVNRLCLEPEAAAAVAHSLLTTELGADAATFLASCPEAQDRRPAMRLAAVDRLFDAGEANSDVASQSTLLGRPVDALVGPLTERLRVELRHWIVERVEDPQQRLPGARRAAAWLREYLVAAERHLQQLHRSKVALTLVARNAAIAAAGPVSHGPAGSEDPALHYFQLRLEQLALLAAQITTAQVLTELRTVASDLAAFENRLGQFQAALSESGAEGPNDPRSADLATVRETLPDTVASVPSEKLAKLATEVGRRVQLEYLNEHGGLLATVMRGGRDRAQLCATLHQYARDAVDRAWASAHAFGAAPGEGSAPPDALSAGLQLATPPLLDHGGTRRVLVIVPRDTADQVAPADVARLLGTEASLVASSDNNLTLCVEAGELSLPHVAADIIEYRQDRRELADRVHCRTDVPWTPLSPMATEPPGTPVAVAPSVPPADASPVGQTELI